MIIRIFILASCCFFAAQNSLAQLAESGEYNIWSLQKNSEAYVFSNKAYIRSGKGLNFPIVDSLSFGSGVTIQQQTESIESIKNIYAPWMKVKATVNGKMKEGFIWLGAFCLNKRSSSGVNFYYGLERIVFEKIKGYSYPKFYIVLKVADAENKIITTKEFKTDGGESSAFNEIKSLGNTKLENLKDVIRISFGGEACGIPTNYYYFGFTGDKLLNLPGKYSVGDAGIFNHSETLLFPHEKGGEPGKIIKLIEDEEVPEAEMDKENPKTKKTNAKEVYLWNGEMAVKVKS